MAAGNGSAKERTLFRSIMWIAVIMVTIALTGLSVTGAWIASGGNYFYTGAIAGVELVALASLTLIVFATNNLRRVIGWAIFLSAVTVCILSAERAIKQSFDLLGSPEVMLAEAEQLRERSTRQAEASVGAEERAIQEQTRLRDSIAEMELERTLMTSSGRIREAQQRLCVLNLYPCNLIDGERGEKTLQAMQARGEEITREIALAQSKLTDPSDFSVSTKSDDLLVQAAALEQKAKTVEHSDTWIKATLAALELIRSFAVWAFLLDSTIAVTKRKSEIMEVDADTEVVEAKTERAQAETKLDAAERGFIDEPDPIEDEPADEIDAVELTPQQQRSRKGGRANAHAREAERLVAKVPVADETVALEEAA